MSLHADRTHLPPALFFDLCKGPCKLLEPVIERCADNWSDKLVVSSYDVGSGNNELKVELALRGAMPKALPTVILFQNGKVLTRFEGIVSDEELNDILKANIVPQKKKELVASASSSSSSGLISFASNTADDYMLTP